MATHSSTLAWKNLGTEEPDSPQSRKESDPTEHKQGPPSIQGDLVSKSTITRAKIVFPNKITFAGYGGYHFSIPLGTLLNLLQSGKNK